MRFTPIGLLNTRSATFVHDFNRFNRTSVDYITSPLCGSAVLYGSAIMPRSIDHFQTGSSNTPISRPLQRDYVITITDTRNRNMMEAVTINGIPD